MLTKGIKILGLKVLSLVCGLALIPTGFLVMWGIGAGEIFPIILGTGSGFLIISIIITSRLQQRKTKEESYTRYIRKGE